MNITAINTGYSPSFKSVTPPEIVSKETKVAPKSAEKQSSTPKTGIVQTLKNGIAAFKKFVIKTEEYSKAIVKAGVFGGLALLGTSALIVAKNLVSPKYVIVDKANNVAKRVFLPTWKGKTFAGMVGLGVAGMTFFKASLNVSDKTAKVDHRFNTGHRFENKV